MTKLLTLEVLVSTAVRAVLVAKLVILGISSLTLFILTLRVIFVAKSVISGVLSYSSIIFSRFNNIIFLL